MNQLKSEDDVAEMLTEQNAALFMFVDWSKYASRGREVFKDAETNLAAKSSHRAFSWWIADISSTGSPLSSVLHQWLTSQEWRGKVRMFPNIAMGNGSVLWMKNGEIVEFHANAERLGLDELMRLTEKVLAESKN